MRGADPVTVRDRGKPLRGRAQQAAERPGVTGSAQAMVLIGLIIIGIVLMVLGVASIRWKLSVPMPAAGPDRAGPVHGASLTGWPARLAPLGQRCA
jgi:hypothetical protein